MAGYPSDLSDKEWSIVKPFLGESKKRRTDTRSVFNAILYLVKTGCQWRYLPKEYPNYQTVFYFFNSWKHRGVLEKIQLGLTRRVRKESGKNEEPTAAIIDSQSIKSTLVSTGGHTGYDAGKKIKGLKRHITVDTLGLLLCVCVHSAAVQDRDGAEMAIKKMNRFWKNIGKIFADGGYQGDNLFNKIKNRFNYIIEIIKRTDKGVFKVLPKRWIVERTFSWIDTNRRTSKSYERYPLTVEAVTQIAATRIMLRKIK
jgi:putative transposase